MSSSKSKRTREFCSRSTALDTVKGLNLSGKTFAITGTTSGIGIETARALALKGAHIVMLNRNVQESEKQKRRLQTEKSDVRIDIIRCDLSSLESVKSAAEEYKSRGFPLHALILNAGVFGPNSKTTSDGFEAHFGVNHLAHFLLTRELLPALRKCAPSRIVFVSSHSHNHTGLKKSMTIEEKMKRLCAEPSNELFYRFYASSKMCNVLTAFKFHREEFESHGVSSYAAHPGLISTEIHRDFGFRGKLFHFFTMPFSKTIAQGAAPAVYCAAHPDVATVSGKYWQDCWDDEKDLDKDIARDVELQDELWEHSERLLGERMTKL